MTEYLFAYISSFLILCIAIEIIIITTAIIIRLEEKDPIKKLRKLEKEDKINLKQFEEVGDKYDRSKS